jgi:phage terminase Nu1 subunit (DNA packaging protein)
MDNVANAVGRVPDFIQRRFPPLYRLCLDEPCARLARRVEYAPQRMDLCGRLADDGGDVTEGR